MKITRILLIITTLFLLIWYFINQYKLLWGDGESNFIPNKLEAPIETITINGVSFKMVKVEGGTFRMGATFEQDIICETNERPLHYVTLDDYYIGETEVTEALWKAVMGSKPLYFRDPQKPAHGVSWDDCQDFIQKLNELSGKNFRLPTEAEWEYAARGGKKRQFFKYAGSHNLDEVAWYGEDIETGRVHLVAEKKPNELGLYDMSGNVSEWCNDWYEKNYYRESPSINPQGPLTGSERSLRGGSYCSEAWNCRLTFRFGISPVARYGNIGFRIVVSSDKEPMDSVAKENDVQDSLILSDILPEEPVIKKTITFKGVSFNMVKVEGGTFQMGATPEQGDKVDDDEKPVHSVTLSDYYIGETEVTQALWEAVINSKHDRCIELNVLAHMYGVNPSRTKNPKLPVEYVDWEYCRAFIKELNRMTGMNFRLPTEAEWEYAARGGKKSKGYRYAGSNNLEEVAWYGEDLELGSPHPVAQKKPNELGLYDMSGNASEWCSDWYGSYTSESQINPKGAEPDSSRVIRGGSWSGYDNCCVSKRSSLRVSKRSGLDADYFICENGLGFRLVHSVDNSFK